MNKILSSIATLLPAAALLLASAACTHAEPARGSPGSAAPLAAGKPTSTQTPAAAPDRVLTGTYWKLVELGGQMAVAFENQREAHLIFGAPNNRVGGSSGCNNLSGTYTQAGAAIAFDALASTRRMCAAGMDQEATMLTAMKRVRAWAISGNRLTLRDEAGALLARFEAVDLK